MFTPKLQGYYRFPAINGDCVVFVSEDDLWTVPAAGGMARRLTSNLGECSCPALSPDGGGLAFSGKEEGTREIYCMSAEGGPAKRLTYTGADCQALGWSRDGENILYWSNSGQPFERFCRLFSVPKEGGLPRLMPYGPALHISYGPDGGTVIGRNTTDLSRWKRYRGGRAGEILIDTAGNGNFRRLPAPQGNVTCPMWLGKRIYFISDHEGIGRIYSCLPSGRDLKRHTSNDEFYARNASTDGRRIIYHCGGELFLLDPVSGGRSKIAVQYCSPGVQRNRKFVEAAGYFEDYDVHPNGHSTALISRGRAFSFSNWEGAVRQYGAADAVRYRLARWLKDGERLLVVSDEGGRERLEIYKKDSARRLRAFENLELGRIAEIKISPKEDVAALSNHRQELILVDLKTGKTRLADKSRFFGVCNMLAGSVGSIGFNWSPDGGWLAYDLAVSARTSEIRLYELASGKSRSVTRPVLRDSEPAFDPGGKYLYFISCRDFDPVYDQLQFDLNFPKGMRPCLVTLRQDLPSPFIPLRKEPEPADKDKKEKDKKDEKPLMIDLDGIQERALAFPVPEGRYGRIAGISGEKAVFTSFPVEGSLNMQWFSSEPQAKAALEIYDFTERKKDILAQAVTDFAVSRDLSALFYRSGNKLRALKAGEKPDEKSEKEGCCKKSGWIDLGRVKVGVNPPLEWKQMYDEAWRLQKEQFWVENMSGVDWKKVYDRYLPLLERVACRSEFSDLIWEMQGELGTSHCYELGGDYRPEPKYPVGLLAADLAYDKGARCHRFVHIAGGDSWDCGKDSPLNSPGINVKNGDRLLEIGGVALGPDAVPGELLANKADCEVELTVAGRDARNKRTVTVKTLKSEFPVRYREWVNGNRAAVHKAAKGRAGYIHIPDMGPVGYAEFHRAYFTEAGKEALIVDVRYNRGGHVSQLLLEKLARKRIGYDFQRWGPPEPYPADSVLGPIVALTNEHAGSDGDIFSHSFKLMKLGPLIGKRTWGGVIGIWSRHWLVDKSLTTQPEFSFWFKDVGWKMENYGTEPDIEVDIFPRDYCAGKDPQLERAVEEVLKALQKHPPKLPDFKNKPLLSLPRPAQEAVGKKRPARRALRKILQKA
ncbi:MAG: PDZ domain-containing protein [Elusimicrobia bacterium]|nr:PDZ domain-containing protein [Elusimicrobiota bacterium]